MGNNLPKDIEAIIEIIARSVHEEWMRGRIAQGWRYGKVRDEEFKTTPCIVPYEELTEQEKEYDRTTARATIKCIIDNGFDILKR